MCPGMRMPLVVHVRTPRYTARGTSCEECWVFAVFAELERPQLCQGTGKELDMCGVHRLLKHGNSSLQLVGHIDEEHWVFVVLLL